MLTAAAAASLCWTEAAKVVLEGEAQVQGEEIVAAVRLPPGSAIRAV